MTDLILYEDGDLLVVNKPSGLPSQATVDPNRANLFDLLKKSERWSYLGLHHRLDAGTSGVVLLTKSKRANLPIADGFKKRTIHKKYRCWIFGAIKHENVVIENYLKAEKLNGRMKMKVVRSGGDYAKTEFLQIHTKSIEGVLVSQLEANLHTGRMHQIRIHCNALGTSIIGDEMYREENSNLAQFKKFKPNRLFLHAYSISFIHPFLEKEIQVIAPLPEEFLNLESV